MPRAILVLEFMVVLLRFSLAHLGQQICDEHHPRKTAGAQLILLAITIALQSKLRCHHGNRRRVPELSNEQGPVCAKRVRFSVLTMAKTFLLSLTEGCRQFGKCKFIAARTPFLESGRKRALLGARCFSFNRDFLPIGSIEKVIAP
jgi:hypothetical protein